jgi:SAM-dependent methyltransferase
MFGKPLEHFLQFPPIIIALLFQFIGFLTALLSFHIFTFKVTPIVFAYLCGLIAVGLSYIANQAKWWLIIQFFFAPALVTTLGLQIQPNFFLASFLIMLLVFWNIFRTQVPLYLSSEKVWCELENFLPHPKPDMSFTFVDVGSGLGGVLTHLAKTRPDGNYFGVESAPLPFLWSWLRIRFGTYRQCRVQWGSLWNCDLSHYDVVFAYLSPAPMNQLWNKARAEMRPGTIFISSTFAVPGQLPFERIKVNDFHHSTLLIWRM